MKQGLSQRRLFALCAMFCLGFAWAGQSIIDQNDDTVVVDTYRQGLRINGEWMTRPGVGEGRYLAKFDEYGDLVWFRMLPEIPLEGPLQLAIDTTNQIILIGTAVQPAAFKQTSRTLFVAIFDEDGGVVSIKQGSLPVED